MCEQCHAIVSSKIKQKPKMNLNQIYVIEMSFDFD